MPDSFRSVVRHAALAACLFGLFTVSVAAQTPLAISPTTPQFMPRYDFHMSAAGLAVDDPRFTWDTHWGGDFDLVDYVRGRMIFLADYQAILGSEFRAFDPNQGNYTLAAAGSWRAGQTEFVGVLHHVSRHLSDRPKRIAIAWNELDLRVLRQFATGDGTIDLRAEIGKVIARAQVDYSWTGAVDMTVRQDMSRHVAAFGRAYGQLIGLIEDAGRERQKGGRLEGGIRLNGQGGALELFVGVERVIDAEPFDREPRNWAFAGFRIVTK